MKHSSVKHETVMVNNITIFDIVSHLICFHINFSNITYYIIVSLNISSFSKFTIIMSPKQSFGDILCLLRFLLLLLLLFFLSSAKSVSDTFLGDY